MEIGWWGSIGITVGSAVVFVGSLYVWKGALQLHHSAPETLRLRFISAGLTATVVALLVCLVEPSQGMLGNLGLHSPPSYPERLGLRDLFNTMLAILWVVALNTLLFAGSWVRRFLEPRRRMPTTEQGRRHKFYQFLRTQVAAPITEEVVYRVGGAYFLLLGGHGWATTLLMPSAVFSLSHANHFLESVFQDGIPVGEALPQLVGDLLMTFVFGLYSMYAFLTTNCLLAVMALHFYCNYLGPPSFSTSGLTQGQGRLLHGAYLLGIAAFFTAISYTQTAWFQSLYGRNVG